MKAFVGVVLALGLGLVFSQAQVDTSLISLQESASEAGWKFSIERVQEGETEPEILFRGRMEGLNGATLSVNRMQGRQLAQGLERFFQLADEKPLPGAAEVRRRIARVGTQHFYFVRTPLGLSKMVILDERAQGREVSLSYEAVQSMQSLLRRFVSGEF